MKKFTKLFTSSVCLVLLITTSVIAQIPADQKVVIIDPAVPGSLETTINGDVDENGNRVNPNRIYQLQKDGIYIMNSAILFGGSGADSTSTLIIEGETGGKLPVVLMNPSEGGNAFTNVVHGSLTIKNVYWPDQALNSTGASLFQMFRTNQRLILENFVTESVTNGDLFNLEQVRGTMDIYFKNCYFRDNTQFANPWNFATFARGNGAQAIDTLWIENTTVGNAGLTFFGKGCPINFTFFNHNTIINVAKYVFFFEQYKEAYFTNNIFVNCNWQGEDDNMGKTQLESQAASGTGNPPVFVGVLNLMEMNENAWTLGHGAVPAMEDVKWMASNNIHFTSPFLNKYYNGEYGDGQAYPVSYINWSVLPAETTYPLRVKNIPPMFMSEKTQDLVDTYPGIVAESNLIQVDPQMVTPGIADQAEGDLYAQWARNNYAIEGVTLPDDATFSFGDQDPTTIPGIETEDGDGFTNVTDLLEDFSYTADISSKIDNDHLGSLAWFPGELEAYDGAEALASVKAYYQTQVNPTGVNDNEARSAILVYPNPTSGIVNIDNPSTGSYSYEVINITGKTVMNRSDITGKTTKLNLSGLAKGLYIINVTSEGISTKHKVILGDL
jgi:hypothetical protein